MGLKLLDKIYLTDRICYIPEISVEQYRKALEATRTIEEQFKVRIKDSFWIKRNIQVILKRHIAIFRRYRAQTDYNCEIEMFCVPVTKEKARSLLKEAHSILTSCHVPLAVKKRYLREASNIVFAELQGQSLNPAKSKRYRPVNWNAGETQWAVTRLMYRANECCGVLKDI